MRIPQLRIDRTYAQIGLQTTPPRQEIRQPKAELNMRQVAATLSIERTPARLEIDQTQAWNERNLKDMLTFTRDLAEEARQLAMEGIARRAQEGDRLARIEDGGHPIADIALENTTPGPLDFNVGFIPSYGAVKIHVTPGSIQLNWQLGGVSLDPEIHRPTHEYTPGKVEVYLRQKPSLVIDWVGGQMDERI